MPQSEIYSFITKKAILAMKKGILILSSAALIGFTTSCGGGGDKAKELQAEVDSLEQRMQFVTDSLTNSWQSKLDSAIQATKKQMRAAMSSSGGSSNNSPASKEDKGMQRGGSDSKKKNEGMQRGGSDEDEKGMQRGG